MKFYLVYIPLAIIATILIILYLKEKKDEQRYKFLIIISFFGLALHLIKPFFFPYNTYEMPDILRKITFENICAVSALIYPFVLIFKNKTLLDYIATIGMIGGIAAFFYPTEVILGMFDSMTVVYEHKLFAFDTIRFFAVHYIIFIVPMLLLYYQLHTFELKRIIYFPITIMSVLTLIFLNELILEKLGWLNEVHNFYDRNIFYDHNIRNSSFVFGITDSLRSISGWLLILVPQKWQEPIFRPVYWILFPIIIYGPILYYLFYFVTNKINKRKLNLISSVKVASQ